MGYDGTALGSSPSLSTSMYVAINYEVTIRRRLRTPVVTVPVTELPCLFGMVRHCFGIAGTIDHSAPGATVFGWKSPS